MNVRRKRKMAGMGMMRSMMRNARKRPSATPMVAKKRRVNTKSRGSSKRKWTGETSIPDQACFFSSRAKKNPATSSRSPEQIHAALSKEDLELKRGIDAGEYIPNFTGIAPCHPLVLISMRKETRPALQAPPAKPAPLPTSSPPPPPPPPPSPPKVIVPDKPALSCALAGVKFSWSARPPTRMKRWKDDPYMLVQPVEAKEDIVGNTKQFVEISNLVKREFDLRGSGTVMIVSGPSGCGKLTAITTACRMSNCAIVVVDACDLRRGPSMFVSDLNSLLVKANGTQVVLTGIDAMGEGVQEGLIDYLEDSVFRNPDTYNTLWMVANSTASTVIQTLRGDQLLSSQISTLFFDRPTTNDMGSLAIRLGMSISPQTKRKVVRANGDIRAFMRMREFDMPESKEGNIDSNPFSLTVRLFQGNRDLSLLPISSKFIPNAVAAVMVDSSLIADIVHENYTSVVNDFDDCVDLADLFSTMDMLDRFVPGDVSVSETSGQAFAANLMVQSLRLPTVVRHTRPFFLGAKRSQRVGFEIQTMEEMETRALAQHSSESEIRSMDEKEMMNDKQSDADIASAVWNQLELI